MTVKKPKTSKQPSRRPGKATPAPASETTTTIRVDKPTHGRLMQIAEELDMTIIDLVRVMTRSFDQQRGRDSANRQLLELRKDPAAWAEFLGGDEEWPELNEYFSKKGA